MFTNQTHPNWHYFRLWPHYLKIITMTLDVHQIIKIYFHYIKYIIKAVKRYLFTSEHLYNNQFNTRSLSKHTIRAESYHSHSFIQSVIQVVKNQYLLLIKRRTFSCCSWVTILKYKYRLLLSKNWQNFLTKLNRPFF